MLARLAVASLLTFSTWLCPGNRLAMRVTRQRLERQGRQAAAASRPQPLCRRLSAGSALED